MSSGETHQSLLFFLRRVLRSLARLLIRVGVRFDEFAAVAQNVFIESAIRDLEYPSIPSRGRIATVTGLTRRQVNRHLDLSANHPSADPTMADILVEILHKWHTTPGYAGPYGIPLELEFSTPPSRCFCSLVALVDPKIDAARAVEELHLVGAITWSGDKRFRAVSRSLLMSTPASPQLIEHFGMTLWRLARTMEHNMESKDGDKLLQRRVSADRGLPVELVPVFEKYVRSRATELLLDLDNWFASRISGDSSAHDRVDAGVDVFLYIEPTGDEAPLADLVTASESKTSTSR